MREQAKHKRWGERTAREKGIVILMTAIWMCVLIPCVGLAVDAGMLYVLKARLQTSVDAASIAAARSLSVGISLGDQAASAQARALAFYNANFKAGSFGTKNQSVNVSVAETAFRTRTVTVTGSFDAPQFFMRYLGFNSTRVNAMGKASRRDVNLILVLDRSGSMQDTPTNGQPCTTMKNSATTFVNMFAEGRDRLSLITFGGAWYPNYLPSMNFKTSSPSLPTAISNISCSGGTASGTAVWNAYQQLVTINEPGALNLIVFFTDGYANMTHADYPVKTLSDQRYGYSGGYKQWSSTYNSYSGATVCNDTGATCTMEPSPCQDAQGDKYDRTAAQTTRNYTYSTTPPTTPQTWNPTWAPAALRGALTQNAGDQYTLSTGSTYGLVVVQASSATDVSDPLIPATGCAFKSDASDVRRDVAYIPDTDIYGNNTTGYKAIDVFPGSTHPYYNKKRPDVPMAVTGVGMNVLDNASNRARNDVSLAPVIYTIGLGSNGGVDGTLLARVANDKTSPIWTSTQQTGLYVYAANVTDLNYAFARVASEILRIAQ